MENNKNFYSLFVWFKATFPGFLSVGICAIKLKTPAIISHRVVIPSSLVLFFHHLYMLVESFSFLLIQVSKVFGEIIKIAMEIMNFYAYISSNVSKFIKHVVHQFFIAFSFVASDKTLIYFHKRIPSRSLNIIIEFTNAASLILIWRPSNIQLSAFC